MLINYCAGKGLGCYENHAKIEQNWGTKIKKVINVVVKHPSQNSLFLQSLLLR
jgi:hypothetical protein